MGKFVTLTTESFSTIHLHPRIMGTTIALPREAEVYLLSGEEKLRSRNMTLI